MGNRFEAIKEGAWSRIDSGVAYLERNGRNIVLATGIGVASVAGGVTVVEAVNVINDQAKIDQAKPTEITQLKEQQRADFGIAYGGFLVTLMGASVALNMHLLNEGYLFWHSPFPIGRIKPGETLFSSQEGITLPAPDKNGTK